MRSLLLPVLSIAAAFGGISAASSADIPRPILKAPAAAAAINWTGFYLNGGLGYGMWVADTQSLNPVT